jgi:hypothetical protein
MITRSFAGSGTPALTALTGAVLLALAGLTGPGPAAARLSIRLPAPVPQGTKTSYHQAVLAAHPVAYWRLGERPGARSATDATPHQHHGTYRSKPLLGQPGALALDRDTAMGLDGPKAKAYVEVPAHKAFSVATSGRGLSVEVWLRPDALDFAGENKDAKNAYIHWLGKGEKGAFEWGFRFYNRHAERSNRISAYIWNRTGGEGAGAYFEGKLVKHQWIHIVATFDDPETPDARVRIYKDGEPSKHNASPGTLYKSFDIKPTTGTAPVRLGTRDLRGFLTGGLDEVAVYPYVLTPQEIRRHWLLGSKGRNPK